MCVCTDHPVISHWLTVTIRAMGSDEIHKIKLSVNLIQSVWNYPCRKVLQLLVIVLILRRKKNINHSDFNFELLLILPTNLN